MTKPSPTEPKGAYHMSYATETYNRFQRLREDIGDDALLEAIAQYYSSDQLNELCESIEDDYDLPYFREEY